MASMATPQTPRPLGPLPAAGADGITRYLVRHGGMGLVGTGAASFVRALLVDVFTAPNDRSLVYIGRRELIESFAGAFDDELSVALAPRLVVFECVEDAIEHIKSGREPVGGCGGSITYWITAPGKDSDDVLALSRQSRHRNLLTMMLGDWPHGPTYDFTVDSATVRVRDAQGRGRELPSLSPEEAVAAIRTHLTSS